jgi:DNA-binding response OmpR family regulator
MVSRVLSPSQVENSMQKVLLVDDDPDLLAILSMSIESAGFCVSTACTGPDALKQAQDLPDLILLDLVLPELDGFAVCQTLKKNRATASIPIIIMTGLSSESNRTAGLESGASCYITKPFTPDELIEKIRTLLNGAGVQRLD